VYQPYKERRDSMTILTLDDYNIKIDGDEIQVKYKDKTVEVDFTNNIIRAYNKDNIDMYLEY
jgi:hypothetical protein